MTSNLSEQEIYVLQKALAIAIAVLEKLPPERRMASGHPEMLALLTGHIPDRFRRRLFAAVIEEETGYLPDLSSNSQN